VDAASARSSTRSCPRDVVAARSRGIARGGATVYLSLRDSIPPRPRALPEHQRAPARVGPRLARDLLPVAPAAHYCMGGVRRQRRAQRSPRPLRRRRGACTGVQGANRLASNSLLECLVFGRRAGRRPTPEGWDGGPPAPQVWGGQAFCVGGRERDVAPPRPQRELPPRLGRLGRGTPPRRPPRPRPWRGARRRAGLTALVADLAADPAPATADRRWWRPSPPAPPCSAARARGAHHRTDAPDTDPRWRGRIPLARDAGPPFRGDCPMTATTHARTPTPCSPRWGAGEPASARSWTSPSPRTSGGRSHDRGDRRARGDARRGDPPESPRRRLRAAGRRARLRDARPAPGRDAAGAEGRTAIIASSRASRGPARALLTGERTALKLPPAPLRRRDRQPARGGTRGRGPAAPSSTPARRPPASGSWRSTRCESAAATTIAPGSMTGS
jgi:hypothetical protein